MVRLKAKKYMQTCSIINIISRLNSLHENRLANKTLRETLDTEIYFEEYKSINQLTYT